MASLTGTRISDEADFIPLLLYSRPGCHLCEDAKEALVPLIAGSPIRIEERNVEDRPEWEEAYGEQIPVGVIGGRRIFKFRVDTERVARALAEVLKHRRIGR